MTAGVRVTCSCLLEANGVRHKANRAKLWRTTSGEFNQITERAILRCQLSIELPLVIWLNTNYKLNNNNNNNNELIINN